MLYRLCSFSASLPDGGVWLAARPDCFTPSEKESLTENRSTVTTRAVLISKVALREVALRGLFAYEADSL
jgi:hypothetical protein